MSALGKLISDFLPFLRTYLPRVKVAQRSSGASDECSCKSRDARVGQDHPRAPKFRRRGKSRASLWKAIAGFNPTWLLNTRTKGNDLRMNSQRPDHSLLIYRASKFQSFVDSIKIMLPFGISRALRLTRC